jgi:hypothetical protein
VPYPGALIIEIQDPTQKVLLVDFMVEDAIQIGPGMKAEVDDFDLGIEINAMEVDQVYPKAFVTLSELGVKENRQTVEISLPESAAALAYGLELETRVMLDAPRKVLMIPRGAIIEKDDKQYVEVLVDGDAVEREIKTGVKMNGNVEIRDGLDQGEEVILNYQED